MDVSEARRLRGLEEENQRLKGLVAEQALRHPGAQGSPRKKRVEPAEGRLAVRHAIDVHSYSERRACQLTEMNRRTFRRPPGPECDAELRIRLRGLAEEHRRFGSPRLQILLRRSECIGRKGCPQTQAPPQADKPSASGTARSHAAELALGHGLRERLPDKRLQASYADCG